jgi:LPXTG-site transpeptidase (sortase) family protein
MNTTALTPKEILANLKHQQEAPFLERFQSEYAELQSLPSKKQRSLCKHWKRSLANIALILALGGTMMFTRPAQAAGTINVTAGAAGISNGDGCSLVEAIINANDDAATHPECATGSGVDTINLFGGNTYTYTAPFGTASALPDINSSITIEANGSTIERDVGSATDFRIIRVNQNGNLTLKEATISGGKSRNSGSTQEQGGGGIFNYNGVVTINNSTISGNNSNNGGGIRNYAFSNPSETAATFTINNSTISGNSATNGGGISNRGYAYAAQNATAVTTLNNSTVTGNSALGGGGTHNYALYSVAGATVTGTIDFNQSLVSGNTGLEVFSYAYDGGVTANNENLFGHSGQTNAQAFAGFSPSGSDINATKDGTNQALTDILNTTLADNGGPTKTHALVVGSPAIDAAAVGLTVDQRNITRPQDGNDDSVTAFDIGAYEKTGSIIPLPSSDGEGEQDPNSFPSSDEEEEEQDPNAFPVGSEGGTFTQGRWTVVVPAGTLPDGSILRKEDINWVNLTMPETGLISVGYAHEVTVFGPDGKKLTQFYPPLTVCFDYNAEDLDKAGGNPDNLLIGSSPGGVAWTPHPSIANSGRVCATINHLTHFAIFIPSLPNTGFAPNMMTTLAEQPVGKEYFKVTPEGVDMSPKDDALTPANPNSFILGIPDLGVFEEIIGVPLTGSGWDVNWLHGSVGYLEGTAFPTWKGNTVLSAHVYEASGLPGPFVDLGDLQWGDKVEISSWGKKYTYEVRSVSRWTKPDDLETLKHEELDWVTLVTCRSYDEDKDEYLRRTVVRAVLVSVEQQ